MTQYISHFNGQQVDRAVAKVLEGVTKSALFKSDIGFIDANQSGVIEELVVTPISIQLVDGDQLSIYSNDLAISFECQVALAGGPPLSPGTTLVPVVALDGGPFEATLEQGDPLYLQGISLSNRLNNIINELETHSGQISLQSGAIVASLTAGGVASLSQDYSDTDDTTELAVSPLLLDLAQGDILFIRDRISLELVIMEVDVDREVGDTTIPLASTVNFNALEGDQVSLAADSFASRMIVLSDSIGFINLELTDIDGRLDAAESAIIVNADEIILQSSKITDLEGDSEEAFSRITLTENSITQLVQDVDNNIAQISVTSGRIETLIERGLGTSKIAKTTATVSGSTNIPVDSTRFTLYEGDDIIFVDAQAGTEFYRKAALYTPVGSTNIHIDAPIADMIGGSSVVLDAKFLRSSLVQQAGLLSSTISDLSDLQGDLTTTQGDLSLLESQFTQTVSDLSSSITATQLSSSIGRITSSLDGSYDSITITDLEAVLQEGDELYIVNQNTNNTYKIVVAAYRGPGAEVVVPLDDFYALQTVGTSYVLLRLSQFSSNFSQALDQIELSLNQIQTLDGRVTSNESAITIQQGEINLRVTETQYRSDLEGQSLGLIASVSGSTITLQENLAIDLYEGDRLLIRVFSGEWGYEILAEDAPAGQPDVVIDGSAEAYDFTFSTVMLDMAGPKAYGSQLSIFLDSIEADTNLFKHSSFDGAVIETPGSDYGKIDLSDLNPYGTQGWALGMDSNNQAVLITHNIYARGIIEGPNLLIDTEASEIDLGNIEMRGSSNGYLRFTDGVVDGSTLSFGPGLSMPTAGGVKASEEYVQVTLVANILAPSGGFYENTHESALWEIEDPSVPLIFDFEIASISTNATWEVFVQARVNSSSSWEVVSHFSNVLSPNTGFFKRAIDVLSYGEARFILRIASINGDDEVVMRNIFFSQYYTRTIIREDGIFMAVAPGVLISILQNSSGEGGSTGVNGGAVATRESLGIAEDDEVTFAKVTTTDGAEFGDDVTITGDLFATNKHFRIPDRDKEGKTITYSSLEGNQNAVFLSGNISGAKHTTIDLPREWRWLVDTDNLIINLTCHLGYSNIACKVDSIENKVHIYELSGLNFYVSYLIIGTRKDIDPLKVYD